MLSVYGFVRMALGVWLFGVWFGGIILGVWLWAYGLSVRFWAYGFGCMVVGGWFVRMVWHMILGV